MFSFYLYDKNVINLVYANESQVSYCHYHNSMIEMRMLCVCVRACVRACVRVCVCVGGCGGFVCVCGCVYGGIRILFA